MGHFDSGGGGNEDCQEHVILQGATKWWSNTFDTSLMPARFWRRLHSAVLLPCTVSMQPERAHKKQQTWNSAGAGSWKSLTI